MKENSKESIIKGTIIRERMNQIQCQKMKENPKESITKGTIIRERMNQIQCQKIKAQLREISHQPVQINSEPTAISTQLKEIKTTPMPIRPQQMQPTAQLMEKNSYRSIEHIKNKERKEIQFQNCMNGGINNHNFSPLDINNFNVLVEEGQLNWKNNQLDNKCLIENQLKKEEVNGENQLKKEEVNGENQCYSICLGVRMRSPLLRLPEIESLKQLPRYKYTLKKIKSERNEDSIIMTDGEEFEVEKVEEKDFHLAQRGKPIFRISKMERTVKDAMIISQNDLKKNLITLKLNQGKDKSKKVKKLRFQLLKSKRLEKIREPNIYPSLYQDIKLLRESISGELLKLNKPKKKFSKNTISVEDEDYSYLNSDSMSLSEENEGSIYELPISYKYPKGINKEYKKSFKKKSIVKLNKKSRK